MESYSRGEHEDRATGTVESQTAKIPSIGFLGVAIAAMAASAMLKASGKDDWALFVGQWVPSILVIGTYNKLVKLHGSDASSAGSARAA